MFKLDLSKIFKKKNDNAENIERGENLPAAIVEETIDNEIKESENNLPAVSPNKPLAKKRKAEIKIPESECIESKEEDGDAAIFAALLGESAEQVKDDFRLHGIRRFCSRLAKLNVRYEIKDGDGLKIVDNCSKLGVSEILVSPAYLGVYRRAVNKSGISGQKICALIDFPFGESSFKSKTTDIKSCLKYGVDGFTVVMPAVAVKNAGELKSEMKKLGKVSKKETGVAFSASELEAENIKLILKTAEKAGLSSLTFAFGDETEEEIRNKCEIIRKNKGKTEIRILGNVRTANAVAAVIALGADKVITPYADEIALSLAKSFGIKKVKLS